MLRASLLIALLVGLTSFLGAEELKVMTFNIRYGTAKDGANHWRHRSPRVIETIKLENPDVLGLQEVLHFQLEALQKALPEYRFYGVGRTDGKKQGEYVPIAWRADRFTLTQSKTHWLSDTPDKPGSMSWGNTIPRIASEVHLSDAAGSTIWHVVNAHFDHRSANARKRSAEALTKLFPSPSTQPAVLMGDFNMGESAPGTMHFKEHGWQDSFRMVHPDAKDTGTFVGWTDRRTGAKIDAVYVNDRVAVKDAEIVRRRFLSKVPSDHDPVSATVSQRTR